MNKKSEEFVNPLKQTTELREKQLTPGYRVQPRFKNVVHLWEFLLELLEEESCRSLITWNNKERREFKLRNPEEVATRWGVVKRRRGMNYEKLSRALRYYYAQGIIKKVKGQRLVYQFNKLPYKYEPERIQSLYRLHRPRKMDETSNEQLNRRLLESPPQQFNPANTRSSVFNPTSTPHGKGCSWPVTPIPTRPVCWHPVFPAPVSRACAMQSRIIFPPANALSSFSISLDVEPVNPVYPAYVKPVKPVYQAYVKPVKPVYPAYVKPVKPVYPAYVKPVKPVYPAYARHVSATASIPVSVIQKAA